jgi:hypothetical protein
VVSACGVQGREQGLAEGEAGVDGKDRGRAVDQTSKTQVKTKKAKRGVKGKYRRRGCRRGVLDF